MALVKTAPAPFGDMPGQEAARWAAIAAPRRQCSTRASWLRTKNGGLFAATASASRHRHSSRRIASAGPSQQVAAFDAPDGIHVGRRVARVQSAMSRAQDSWCQASRPLACQFGLEAVGERLEVTRVVAGITFHPLGQRAQRPVGLLRPLLQLHAQVASRPGRRGRTGARPAAARRAWCRRWRWARTRGACAAGAGRSPRRA